MTEERSAWWGSFHISLGHCYRWQVGPLALWLQRLEGEWRMAHNSGVSLWDASFESYVKMESSFELINEQATTRFGVQGRSERIHLVPALADRAVVSSPEQPLAIPAGEEVNVYIGSPLWLQVMEGESPNLLCEFAIHQPADTWFGPNTQQGELCYASRSFCRLQSHALKNYPHRAHSTVTVQNKASTPLRLERMQIPVPLLSLYQHPETGVLWTEDITLQRQENGELVSVRVNRGAPSITPNARLVSKPRKMRDENVMMRAFASLFPNG